MLDAVIGQIILLKPTIITAAIGTLIVLFTLLFVGKRFSWNATNVGIIGLFYESTYHESILMAVCLIKIFLVLSMLFSGTRLSMVHLVMYGALVVIYNVIRHSIKEVMISLFNGAIIIGVLYISMFLLSYLKEVLFDVKIVIALVMLSIFLIMYSVYDLMWSILNIVSARPMTYNPKDVEYGYLNTSTPEYIDAEQIKETIAEILPEPVDQEPIEEYLGVEDDNMFEEELEELNMTKDEWKQMVAEQSKITADSVELDIINLNDEG